MALPFSCLRSDGGRVEAEGVGGGGGGVAIQEGQLKMCYRI
jgi:hypothetical protein